MLVAPAISGAHCKWAAAKASVHLQIPFQTCTCEKQPTSKWREGDNFDSGGEVAMEVVELAERTTKSHALVEEHD